jgi:endogenous inhibitor of DNA gyrase (YacG/DUF329 family)
MPYANTKRTATGQFFKCAECGKKKRQWREWQKFCSGECRMKNWLKLHPRIGFDKEGQDA